MEWTIPRSMLEYNFAKIPSVTSRYAWWEGNVPDIESARAKRLEGKTAADLGIIIPYNTIKPLIVAFGMVLMFGGMMTTHMLIYVGAAIMVGALYAWLLSPLEPEHH